MLGNQSAGRFPHEDRQERSAAQSSTLSVGRHPCTLRKVKVEDVKPFAFQKHARLREAAQRGLQVSIHHRRHRSRGPSDNCGAHLAERRNTRTSRISLPAPPGVGIRRPLARPCMRGRQMSWGGVFDDQRRRPHVDTSYMSLRVAASSPTREEGRRLTESLTDRSQLNGSKRRAASAAGAFRLWKRTWAPRVWWCSNERNPLGGQDGTRQEFG